MAATPAAGRVSSVGRGRDVASSRPFHGGHATLPIVAPVTKKCALRAPTEGNGRRPVRDGNPVVTSFTSKRIFTIRKFRTLIFKFSKKKHFFILISKTTFARGKYCLRFFVNFPERDTVFLSLSNYHVSRKFSTKNFAVRRNPKWPPNDQKPPLHFARVRHAVYKNPSFHRAKCRSAPRCMHQL